MSPVLPWESRKGALLIRCSGAFHPHHVTTRLCLRLLDLHRERLARGRVLDVGCGTGILAITAARMGARSAVGVDISRPAVELARLNAVGNAMDRMTHWVQGSAESVGGTFDWVVANLPFNIQVSLFDELLGSMGTEGYLLLSGFHDIELPHVERRLKLEGLSIQDCLSGDLSFAAEPPSGSYTWIAVLAAKD